MYSSDTRDIVVTLKKQVRDDLVSIGVRNISPQGLPSLKGYSVLLRTYQFKTLVRNKYNRFEVKNLKSVTKRDIIVIPVSTMYNMVLNGFVNDIELEKFINFG